MPASKKDAGSFAYNILSNWEDSEERVSDTYPKAWETISPHSPNTFLDYYL